MEGNYSVYAQLYVTAFYLLPVLATVVVSYFLGCGNGSILISKYVFHDDIRTHGSGNAGLTNFYRTFGTKSVAGVLLFDILKAMLAVLLGWYLFGHFLGLPMLGKLIATAFVLLGHMYPVTFEFHGGKGILSGVSALILIDWRIALIALGVFFVLAFATRYVSLGSIGAVVTFLVCMWPFYHDLVYMGISAGIAALMIYAHRSNIFRLLHGVENKFTLHRKEENQT